MTGGFYEFSREKVGFLLLKFKREAIQNYIWLVENSDDFNSICEC